MQPHQTDLDPSQPLKPKNAWYLLALLITVLGPFWAGTGIVQTLKAPLKNAITLHDSVQEVRIEHAGTYTFFEHPSLAGKLIKQLEQEFLDKPTPQSQHIKVSDANNNTDIEIKEQHFFPWLQIVEDDQFKLLLGDSQVTFPTPGRYIIAILKDSKTTYVLAQSQPEDLYTPLVSYFVLLLFSLIIGPLMLLTIYLLRQSNWRLQTSPEYGEPGYRREVSRVRLIATTLHLGGLFGYVFPLGHLTAPIFIYAISNQRNTLLRLNLHSVMNFHLSITLYMAITSIFIMISAALLSPFALLFILVLAVLFIIHLVLTIVGAVMTFKDGLFLYPLSIRFLKDKVHHNDSAL